MAAKVILFAADVAFVVQGFRVHWGWGVANIFLAHWLASPFLLSTVMKVECRFMFWFMA